MQAIALPSPPPVQKSIGVLKKQKVGTRGGDVDILVDPIP